MAERSGTESRRLTEVLRVRLTREDLDEISRRADERGVGVAEFVRASLLQRRLSRRKAVPAEIALALANVGRVGGLLRQLRDLADSEGFPAQAGAIAEARQEVVRAVDLIVDFYD